MSPSLVAGPAVTVEFIDGGEVSEAKAGDAVREQLEQAGLDPSARSATGHPVRLTLAPTGWEGLNLAALVALARARPGRPVHSGPAAMAVAPGAVLPAAPLLAPTPPPDTIFLDRDGTILEPVPYLDDPARVQLLPGAAAGLRALAGQGRRLVVLTNQSGVGRGSIEPQALHRVQERMNLLLEEEGIRLDGIFTCPHPPDAGCSCRKPAPGLAREASVRLGLDLGRSMMVGDSAGDVGLARQLHIPAALTLSGNGPATLASGAEPPDLVIVDLLELAWICHHPGGLGVDPVSPSASS